jgi:RNA polymerase sigma factor (sigma-70 family)
MASKLYKMFKKAQKGNEEQVIELYNKFLPLIKGYGRKLNYGEAESDLTIFLLEYINKANFDKFSNRSDGEIVNYIKLIFKNKCIDILRKLKNNKIETMIIETEFIYNDRYKNLEDEYILSLLKSLNVIQKKIIIGRYIHCYSDTKLSKIFNVSRQAIYKQRKKALELIKIEISKNNNQ